MTRVDTAIRLAEIIQRQVEVARGPGRRRLSSAAADERSTTTPGDRPAALVALIARRVGAVDRSAPNARQQAFRLFLESVLLAEMGEAVINDPAFYQWVEQIQARMATDAELVQAMDRAAQILLAPGSTT